MPGQCFFFPTASSTNSFQGQGSSIGIYTTQWFNEFYWSARGESAEDWLDEPKKRREQLPYPPIKVVFPSKTTVQQSRLGEEVSPYQFISVSKGPPETEIQGGGTIFCRRKQWAAKNFPRDRFYDSKSKGGPVLMHSKVIETHGIVNPSCVDRLP